MLLVRLTLIPMLLATMLTISIGGVRSKTAHPTRYHKNVRSRHMLNRKFNTAAFLHGLANSCAQAGNTVAAQTEQEKQQAACNMLASIFQTAATMSEKTHKRSVSSDTMLTTTIRSTITFLNTLSPEEKDHLLAPNCAYLRAITTLPTEKAQAQFITQTLAHKEEGYAFLGELFSLFKTIVSDELPSLFDTIQMNMLQDLNLN